MRNLGALKPVERACVLALHREAVRIGVDPATLEGPGVDALREVLDCLGLRGAPSASGAGICPACGGTVSISRASNPKTGAHRNYCSDVCAP